MIQKGGSVKNTNQLVPISLTKSVEKIRGVKLGSGTVLMYKEQNQIFEPLKSTTETYEGEHESLTAQKLEFTDSQEELDALGLGNLDKKVTLVVKLPMPYSSQSTLAIHEETLNRLVQESKIPINIEQESKIVMIRTSSDLTNRKWVKKFITLIKGGAQELDEELIKSILSKVAEYDLGVPSINKILKTVVEATLEIGSNDKLMRILGKLEKPMNPSVLTGTPPTEALKILDNLQDCQHESESSSSIFTEAFQPPLPRHRSADALMGRVGPRPRTVLNSQSQNQQNMRTLSVHDGSQADITESSADHLLSKHGHNFNVNDKLPPNANQKPTKYPQI